MDNERAVIRERTVAQERAEGRESADVAERAEEAERTVKHERDAVNFKETEEWRRGQRSQLTVERVLKETGCGFIRTHAIEDPDNPGAPALTLGEWEIVLPDLDVTKRGRRFWLEVKGKTKPAWYTKKQRYQHGIDTKNWEAYQHVEEETGSPVYVVIHEQQSGDLLIQSVEELCKVELPGEGSMSHVTYFPRDAFFLWATDGVGEMFSFQDARWVVRAVIA